MTSFTTPEAIPEVQLASRASGQVGTFPRPFLHRLGQRLLRIAGMLWRWIVGAILCLNTLTSVLVVGWSYRWIQGLVLRGWWKQSRLAREGTFDQFLERLGDGAPVARPRWILRERALTSLYRDRKNVV